MTTRLLPREEWPRLNGTEMEAIWPALDAHAHIVVVEDDDGQIVGCWSLFRQVHVEGCWIAPAHRGKSSVARRMLVAMRSCAQAMGARSVATAACSEDVKQLLIKMGAVELPGSHFAMPV